MKKSNLIVHLSITTNPLLFYKLISTILLISCIIKTQAQTYQWQSFNSSNSLIPYESVTAIAFDDSANVWMASWNALMKYDGTNWQYYNYSNSGLTGQGIKDVAIDSQGTIWVATANGFSSPDGVYSFDGTNWQYYNSSSGLPNAAAVRLEKDNIDTLYCGTNDGLAKFDGSTWVTILDSINNGFESVNVPDFAFDSNNNIWAIIVQVITGSGFYYVGYYDHNEWTLYNHQTTSLPTGSYTTIDIDQNGDVWLGTRYDGLYKYDGFSWTNFNVSNSGLPDNYISSFAIDSIGTKWIGTAYKGISLYDNSSWASIDTANSDLNCNSIQSIVFDESWDVWVGNCGLSKGSIILNNEKHDLEETSMEVFPNPNEGLFQVLLENESPERMSLAIVNLLGEVVFQRSYNETPISVDIPYISKGMYFVTVQTDNIVYVKQISIH